jgi:2-oxoglutarate ferredoxin oxidoreductase subunit beta
VRPAPVEYTDDPARAARRLMTDDGFNIGVLYKGSRPPFNAGAPAESKNVEELECQFRL